MDWTFVSLQNLYAETLPYHAEDIRKWGLWGVISIRWGHKVRALMNKINAFIRISRQLASLLCSLPCHEKSVLCNQKRTLFSTRLEPDHTGTLILDFPASYLWGINFCCLRNLVCVILWLQPELIDTGATIQPITRRICNHRGHWKPLLFCHFPRRAFERLCHY